MFSFPFQVEAVNTLSTLPLRAFEKGISHEDRGGGGGGCQQEEVGRIEDRPVLDRQTGKLNKRSVGNMDIRVHCFDIDETGQGRWQRGLAFSRFTHLEEDEGEKRELYIIQLVLPKEMSRS